MKLSTNCQRILDELFKQEFNNNGVYSDESQFFEFFSANNILKPSDGKPVAVPTQDMILGSYYLTLEKDGEPGEGKIFRDENEAMMAYGAYSLPTTYFIDADGYPVAYASGAIDSETLQKGISMITDK